MFASLLASALLAVSAMAESGSRASFVPVNDSLFRMTLPNGAAHTFVRSSEDPDSLSCLNAPGWQAELRGPAAIAVKQDARGGMVGYQYLHGRLRKSIQNGKETDYPATNWLPSVSSLADYWPKESAARSRDASRDFTNVNGGRIGFGWTNVNVPAAMFAELMVLFFWCALCERCKSYRIDAALMTAVALECLAMTQSRGGFVAAIAGCSVVAACKIRSKGFRRILTKRMVVVAVVVLLAVAAIVFAAAGDRFTNGLFAKDRSNSDRLSLWKAAPVMCVDAPTGWGAGRSGSAYNDWYEQGDALHPFGSMINTHLTFMVERGWTLSFAYLFVWLGVLAWGASSARKDGGLVLATTLALGTVSTFNNVGLYWTSWSIPAFAVLALVVFGVKAKSIAVGRKGLIGAGIVAVVSLSLLGGWLFVGHNGRTGVLVRGSATQTKIGGTNPTVWVVEDGHVLNGGYHGFMGRGVRRFYASHAEFPAIGMVGRHEDLPESGERLVAVGRAGEALLADPELWARRFGKIVFVSPSFSWKQVPQALTKDGKCAMLIGELAARTCADFKERPPWVREVKGRELYLPEWLRLSMASAPIGVSRAMATASNQLCDR